MQTMKQIRVLLADFDPEQLRIVESALRANEDICPVGSTSSAKAVLPLLQETGADVLVTELYLSDGDGLELLRRLKAGRFRNVPVIVYSAFCRPALVREAARLGAAYFLEKPYALHGLAEHIRLAAADLAGPSSEEDYLELRVRMLLQQLGLLPNRKAFRYLTLAVCLWVTSEEQNVLISKDIYPAVARRFGVTPVAVERSIRQAIARLWQCGNQQALERMFPCGVPGGGGAPSNSRFLAAMAQSLCQGWRAQGCE